MTYEEIAEKVRKRLVATGATQVEIAEATGLAQSSIGRFLRGTSDPSIANFYAIVRFIQDREAEELFNPVTTAIDAAEKVARRRAAQRKEAFNGL